MNIAVIGAGISGLTAAYILSRRYTITLFESASHCGGHAHTTEVMDAQRCLPVDIGFIVFNEQNYPNLWRLFTQLDVRAADSDMSLSVHCARSGYEYSSSAPSSMFAPWKWPLLKDILRFNRRAPEDLQRGLEDTLTVADYVRKNGYSRTFLERYLSPLGAALWSSPEGCFRAFPVRFVIEFLCNHGMLSVFRHPGSGGRPVWKYVEGGSRVYVRRLLKRIHGAIHVDSPVDSVRRLHGGVEVKLRDREVVHFQEVVLACHADQALSMLTDADEDERAALSCFPYQSNEVVLHTDTRILPRSRRCWASWNYRLPMKPDDRVTVSYNMNRLQAIESNHTYCVSLNPGRLLRDTRVLKRASYAHPQYGAGALAARERCGEFIRRRGVSLCGAYWGYGFHEDGVNSALKVCDAYGMGLDSYA